MEDEEEYPEVHDVEAQGPLQILSAYKWDETMFNFFESPKQWRAIVQPFAATFAENEAESHITVTFDNCRLRFSKPDETSDRTLYCLLYSMHLQKYVLQFSIHQGAMLAAHIAPSDSSVLISDLRQGYDGEYGFEALYWDVLTSKECPATLKTLNWNQNQESPVSVPYTQKGHREGAISKITHGYPEPNPYGGTARRLKFGKPVSSAAQSQFSQPVTWTVWLGNEHDSVKDHEPYLKSVQSGIPMRPGIRLRQAASEDHIEAIVHSMMQWSSRPSFHSVVKPKFTKLAFSTDGVYVLYKYNQGSQPYYLCECTDPDVEAKDLPDEISNEQPQPMFDKNNLRCIQHAPTQDEAIARSELHENLPTIEWDWSPWHRKNALREEAIMAGTLHNSAIFYCMH